MPEHHHLRVRRTARYSRFVAVIKVLLPLLAVVILSTVFLLGSDDTFDAAQIFTQADFDALNETDVLSRARFAGTTVSGDYLSFSTLRLAPDPLRENVLIFDRLAGSATYVSGLIVQILAPTALYLVTDNQLEVPEGGALTTSDGYRGRMGTLHIDLDTSEITGTDLDGTGPLGAMTAGAFRITNAGKENRVIWFTNRVNLRLDQQVNIQHEGQAE